jgi:hypothetical protein
MVLTDEPGQPPSRLPTRANIIQGLYWLVANAQPGDSFFLQYSGHGSRVRDRDGVYLIMCSLGLRYINSVFIFKGMRMMGMMRPFVR